VFAEADPHERIESCEYADAIQSWLDHSPAPVRPSPDSEIDVDIRMVVGISTPRGTELAAVQLVMLLLLPTGFFAIFFVLAYAITWPAQLVAYDYAIHRGHVPTDVGNLVNPARSP
jgi:hypothetical protein